MGGGLARILVVDDYLAMRRLVRNMLHGLGQWEIEEATEGSHALVRLRQDSFQMVISDWDMEPMSGLHLLQAMRADHKLRSVPFIMMSSEHSQERFHKARQAGASGYLVKPFGATALAKQLQRLCPAHMAPVSKAV